MTSQQQAMQSLNQAVLDLYHQVAWWETAAIILGIGLVAFFLLSIAIAFHVHYLQNQLARRDQLLAHQQQIQHLGANGRVHMRTIADDTIAAMERAARRSW
jgi:hypothetical protein